MSNETPKKNFNDFDKAFSPVNIMKSNEKRSPPLQSFLTLATLSAILTRGVRSGGRNLNLVVGLFLA